MNVSRITYARVFTDSTGETHFDDVEIDLCPVVLAPPAPPLDLSPFTPVARYAFCAFSAEWGGDWHSAPRRQFFLILSGELEFEVSDGEVRRFGEGGMVMLEDTAGKGHIARNVGEEAVHTVVVQLPVRKPNAIFVQR